jgi:hypothetical protein
MSNLIEALTPGQSKDVLTTIVRAGLVKETQIRRAVVDRANSATKLVGLLSGRYGSDGGTGSEDGNGGSVTQDDQGADP